MELNPNYSFAHDNRGAILHRMGRHGDALGALDRAIELEANAGWERAGTFTNRGLTRGRLGDFTGAISDFKEAIRITPDYELAERYLTRAIRLRSRADEPQPAPPPRVAGSVPR